MIQFITHYNDRYSYVEGARMALEGGCRWIQLRVKMPAGPEVARIAVQVRDLCREYGAVFIIDDHVSLVKVLNADGVHLGKDDMPIDVARDILGPSKIIGGTANTFEDVERICRLGANYIGCGPFRYTSTKKNLAPVLGLEGYRRIIGRMKEEGLHCPVFAIGGIGEHDINDIFATGVSGFAVSGAVLNADNPVEAMRRLIMATSEL